MLKPLPYRKLFTYFISLLSFAFLSVSPSFASGATINLSPQNGSYGKPFSVHVVVNGNGQPFNAAQATVSLSSNLSVQNLVTGDCSFSFLQTPTITNPSFAGVLLGKSSKQCTVYTMTLAPLAKGTGTITLSKGSVRRFGDAVNILSEMQSGTYTLTSAVKVSPQPTVAPSQGGLYSLLLTLQTAKQTPLLNTAVTLKAVATTQPKEGKTDNQGRVQFTNLQPGIYDALVTNYPGDHILNVRGNNHTLILGITVEPQQNLLTRAFSNPFVLLLLGGILGGGAIGLFLWMRRREK